MSRINSFFRLLVESLNIRRIENNLMSHISNFVKNCNFFFLLKNEKRIKRMWRVKLMFNYKL